ncbi:MAG: hypothetical protein JW892_10220, partial [Anaerolineae bacterium]|nr:hypothetical protein [Anaerolineae bacterium]
TYGLTQPTAVEYNRLNFPISGSLCPIPQNQLFIEFNTFLCYTEIVSKITPVFQTAPAYKPTEYPHHGQRTNLLH